MRKSKHKNPRFPRYMEEKSEGDGVNNLLIFLLGWSRGYRVPAGKRIKCDKVLGRAGMYWIAKYQKVHKLQVSGGCGPQMRASLKKKHGFDLKKVILMGGGVTRFVQTNGEIVEWRSRLAA